MTTKTLAFRYGHILPLSNFLMLHTWVYNGHAASNHWLNSLNKAAYKGKDKSPCECKKVSSTFLFLGGRVYFLQMMPFCVQMLFIMFSCFLLLSLELTRCAARQRKWQKNALGLRCWISHTGGVLNGIHFAMAYNINMLIANSLLSLSYFQLEENFISF